MKIGAYFVEKNQCEFVVWAPLIEKVELKIVSPAERLIPMEKMEWGYWKAIVSDVFPDTQYLYRLDNSIERPDPASHFQPNGVHQPSQVIDHSKFNWRDSDWKGVPLEKMIIYELHVGTFTPEGTFESIIPRLDAIKEIGVNAIELMPIAQFPGERNWGYDGVHPFAVQNSYGGPDKLKSLVKAAHQKGIAVILDVVYNHLGPEGNYLRDFAPYFTSKYQTHWGDAINFDDAHSDGVCNFFIQNALHWFEHYHIDGLRLDAVHAIYDFSAKPFLQELAEEVEYFSKQQGRKYYLIAESNLNDARVIQPTENGGYGIDAQWNDDFHHSVHSLITGEKSGYYIDFGEISHLKKALLEGFVYSGQYSEYRRRRHGNSAADCPAHQFVVCVQNHDQVGNRMLGERLSELVSYEALKLAAGILMLSPYVPLIFMGEEYGERSPFLYFVSHFDPDLIQSIRQGRKAEFQSFQWKGEPPDPQNVDTFLKSKIKWELRKKNKHKTLLNLYKELIRLRKTVPALSNLDNKNIDVITLESEKVVMMWRWFGSSHVFCIFNFNKAAVEIPVKLPKQKWFRVLDSAKREWGGFDSQTPEKINNTQMINLQPLSFALYEKENK